jgi:uncharacterized DUF497 family protein
MRFTWTEAKRKSNIKAHGLDFLDVSKVFEGLTFTFEDDRYFTVNSDSLRLAC